MRRIILYIAAALLIVTGIPVTMALVLTGEHVRPYAEKALSSFAGKPARIATLDIDKGWTTGIHATGVIIEGDEGSGGEPALAARRIEVSIRLRSLFEEHLDFPAIDIDGLSITGIRGTDGQPGGMAGGMVAESADGPPDRTAVVSIGRISVRDSELIHIDRSSGRTDRLTGIEIDGELRQGSDARLSGRADLNGTATRFSLSGGPFSDLVEEDQPYPVRLSLEGPTSLDIEGTLVTSNLGETRLTSVRLSGDDFADLGVPFGIPFPSTPPYDLDGALRFGERSVTLERFRGRIGDSDAAGNLTVDLGGDVPALTGEIRSERLDFDDLAGLLGAAPDVSETASEKQKQQARSQGLVPDSDIPVGLFRGARIDVRLQAASVISPTMEVDDIDARFRLSDGRLVVRPMTAGVAGGVLRGEIAVNAREDLPSADADLVLDGLELGRFFEDTDFVQEMGGRVSGKIYLIGTGRDLEQILATARGGGHLVLRNGMISGLIVEAAGLDVVESLGLLVGGDVRIPMPCAAAAVSADHGRITIRRGTVFTDDSLLVTKGEVDLAAKTIDLLVEALERDFSLIDLTAPVSIRGPVDDPDIRIGGFDPFPFFSMPDEEAKVDCDWLVQDARAAAPGKPVN